MALRLILGSGSPRRLELLGQPGLKPDEIRTPDIDETPRKAELPRDYVRRMAAEKAAAVPCAADEVVLCADTTVALGRRLDGDDEANAFVQRQDGWKLTQAGIPSIMVGGSFSNMALLRSEIRRLFRWLKNKGVTTVITGERGEGMLTRQGLEEYVSDCVILLDHRVVDQISTRRLRIVKYRGTSHGTNEYPFLIDDQGISVLPVTSLGLAHEVSEERVSKTPTLFEQVARIAKRGRKRWLGLCFVTQLPAHLPRQVLGLCNSFVLHKLQDPAVVSLLKRTVGGVDEGLWDRLPNLAPGQALGDAVERVKTIETRIGMPTSIVGIFAGDAAEFSKSLAGQPWLILAALVTIYIVLGVLYESYIHPITILSTLPSAGVGAILALMLCGQDLSVIGLIGIILLMGIVKKNAIMMIDFALEAERHQGMTATDAIVQACLLRFRPIMMTTLAALFGALPLAVESGTGAELRFPLGISIIGGLLLSQLLTLYTTPVIYLALDRLNRRLEQAVPTGGPEQPPIAGATEGMQ